MPQLPLPLAGDSLQGGDVPVSSAAEVVAELPEKMRLPDTAPVRDALTGAFAAGFVEYQNRVSRAAAQRDPLRATAAYLRDLAEEKGVIPRRGESDSSIRSRMFSSEGIVTPAAILAQVAAIVAPFTDGQVNVSELDLDGVFINNGTASWHSFVGAEPEYPDRVYSETPGYEPGGWVPMRRRPRSFYVRIPSLAHVDELTHFVGDSFFAANNSEHGTFLFASQETASNLYSTVVSTISRIKGQGISWTLFVDPRL